MNMKLPAVAVLVCSLTYAAAETTAIGTASARGDLRVDGYKVKGDATLFDGTVVQTGQASAALRVDKGVEIKLSTNARGTLYRDRLVLQQGTSEWTGSTSFRLEANGLRVIPSGPDSRGQVSMSNGNTVQVAALTGEFRVTNNRGLLLGSVRPGNALSFGVLQAKDQGPIPMNLFGTLIKVEDHYYLQLPAPDLGVVYEVTGANLESMIGKKVVVAGTVDLHTKAMGGGATYVIVASSVTEIPPPGMSKKEKVIFATAILGGATALSVGIFEANQTSTPASR